MAKKLLRLTCLVLVAIMLTTMLVGCSLFQLNQERYRAKPAITVGNTSVTVGDFMDFYTGTMTEYLKQGYSAQDVWDNLGKQLLVKYIVLDLIKGNNDWQGVKQNAPYDAIAAKYDNAKYLTGANDVELLLKNIRVSLYDSLNTLTETELSNTYVLKDAEKETERKLNTEKNPKIYAGALTDADFDDDVESLDKKLALYKDCDLTDFNSILQNYVYEEEGTLVADALKKINKRINQDDGVEEGDEGFKAFTAAQYVAAQKSALGTLTRNIKSSYYGWTMEQFLSFQLDSTLTSRLAQEYAVKEYKIIESEVISRLSAKLAKLVEASKESNDFHPSKFKSDVTSLSADTFIYTMPAQYANEYAFVKNMLIKFTDEQTAALKEYEKYGKTSEIYLAFRNKLATEAAATDFESELTDGEHAKIEGVFELDATGNVVLKDGVIKTALQSMSTDIEQRNKDFDKLIDKYNEDTGMQGKTYDYVLRVKKPDVAGTADSWVKEFSAAGRVAVANGEGDYQIAVTDYGVHIVYFSGYVKADTFDFNDQTQLYTKGTATYRFFKKYYDDVKSDIYDEKFQAILDKYFKEGKIKVQDKNIKKLLKDYGFEIKWK